MDRYEEDMAHDTATATNTDDLNENISVAATENPMENDKMKQIESKEDQPRSISNIPTNNSSAVSAKYAGNSEIHKKVDVRGYGHEVKVKSNVEGTPTEFDVKVNSIKERRLFWQNKHESVRGKDSLPGSKYSSTSKKKFSFKTPSNVGAKTVSTSGPSASDTKESHH